MIDFLRYRYVTACVSFFIIAGSIGLYFYKLYTRGYAFTYSVDFTGGTQVLFKFDQPVTGTQVAAILEHNGWTGPLIREFSATEVLVRVKDFTGDTKGLSDRMQQVLLEAIPGNQVSVMQTESVGAGIGDELRTKAFKAVLYALLGILIYIAIVFWSTAFAIGAVVCLAHDALVILATYLVLDRDISINVIGAILAVLGYSMNDTIVIFSQIRKNLHTMRNTSLYTIVNTSINQALRRTLLTSFAFSLTVMSLLFLGGEALRDLALTLFVGIIFGTYSSIYIASPIMMMFYKGTTTPNKVQ